MPEEGLVGTWFRTDIEAEYDFSRSIQTDSLEDTLDYSLLAAICQEEMAKRSKLIETVAGRILERVLSIPGVRKCALQVIKEHPPIDGQVDAVSVSLQGENPLVPKPENT